ncbi:DUF5906 domain-containing protein [Fructobacillus evanidus]|uniref:Phage- or plasmid-associated n=1 Tax=Fructobacillus evanidus TaxID=3064281 RepID=A0ABM9MRV0_9LACO|nr:DNA primase [Fructobacillus sp. LMG 32999]CAK1239570.1 DNA primase [Fructobacillus sp. LMG 32999]
MAKIEKQPKWLIVDGDGKPKNINHLLLAETILKKHPIKVVPFGNDFNYYSYNGVNWEDTKKERALLNAKRYAMDYLKEVDFYSVKRMEDTAKTVIIKAQLQYNPFIKQKTDRVAFKNGTYLLKSGEMLGVNVPTDYLVNGHDYEARPEGTTTNINVWGKYIFGPSWEYVKEIVGYAFIPEQHTFNTLTIILDEIGGTGKSYFISRIILPLIGKANLVAKDIDTLTGSNGKSSRFGTVDFIGKLANIHLDIPDTVISTPDALKTITGGDVVEVEGKGTNAISVELYAKLIFATNSRPKIAMSSALAQRIHLVPVVAPKVRDNPQEAEKRSKKWSESKAVKEIGSFAIECIEAFKQARDIGHLTVNDEIKELTEAWAIEQDLVTLFLSEAKTPLPEGADGGIKKGTAYARFRDWLVDNKQQSKIKERQFNKKLELLGYIGAKTRNHPEGDTENPQASWLGLDLKKYTKE